MICVISISTMKNTQLDKLAGKRLGAIDSSIKIKEDSVTVAE